MPASRPHPTGPAFVVLHRVSEKRWEVLGEVPRRPGVPATAAIAAAIMEATHGTARTGEGYAAVLRSEWQIAQVW